MKRFNYVKLGQNASYLDDCINGKYVQLGFGLNEVNLFNCFIKEQWEGLRNIYLTQGNAGRAGNFIGQLTRARSADKDLVWLTIERGHLFWAQTKKDAEWIKNDKGVTLEVERWSKLDATGNPLSYDRVPGWLMSTAQYRGTVCNAAAGETGQRAESIRRLLAGENSAARTTLRKNEDALKGAIGNAVNELAPKDFELLVELIFSKSGWRRIGIFGRTMTDVDLAMELPTTGELAVVQIKSQAAGPQFQEFLQNVVAKWTCDKFFWIQHTGAIPALPEDNSKVVIWNLEKISEQVLESGLVSWLGNKI